MIDLNKSVKYVKSVGPAKEELLNKLKIYTLKDLITYFPRDYQDRSKPINLCECIDGEEVLIEAMVTSPMSVFKTSRNTVYRLTLRDETGVATAVWYNQKYLRNMFKLGNKYKFFGKVSVKHGRIEIQTPVFDNLENMRNTGKIVPIYPSTFGLSQTVFRRIMENAIAEVDGNLEETIPEYILKKYNLLSLNESKKKIHFPGKLEDFSKARNRLVFEELLAMQLALLVLKNN